MNDDPKRIPIEQIEVVSEKDKLSTDSGHLGTFVVIQEIQKALELLRLTFKFSEEMYLVLLKGRYIFKEKRARLKRLFWHRTFQEINEMIQGLQAGEKSGKYHPRMVKSLVDAVIKDFAEQISSQQSKKSDLIYLVSIIFMALFMILNLMVNPRIKNLGFEKTHSDFPALELPLKQCGRGDSDTLEVWFPILIDEADEEKLDYLQKEYCRHAFFKDGSNSIVQVAALKSEGDAKKLVEVLQSDPRVGNARLGENFIQ